MKHNVLLIGSSGFLGKSLYKHLSSNFEIVPTHTANPVFEHSERYDFFQDDLHALLEKYIPEIIVMAAAVEEDVDAELFRTRVHHFVEICHSHRLIYLSSDAIFDGKKGYYSETDLPSPTTSYGKNLEFLEEEIKIHVVNYLIIRPSYLYGFSMGLLDSRLAKTLELLEAGETVSYFHDMYKSPLGVDQAARIITKLIKAERTGIIHVAGERKSVYDFQLEAMQALGVNVERLKPVQMPRGSELARDTSLNISLMRQLEEPFSIAASLKLFSPIVR
jgi:dTDP-4-dehydrorhamnose reductase